MGDPKGESSGRDRIPVIAWIVEYQRTANLDQVVRSAGAIPVLFDTDWDEIEDEYRLVYEPEWSS